MIVSKTPPPHLEPLDESALQHAEAGIHYLLFKLSPVGAMGAEFGDAEEDDDDDDDDHHGEDNNAMDDRRRLAEQLHHIAGWSSDVC